MDLANLATYSHVWTLYNDSDSIVCTASVLGPGQVVVTV